MKLAKELVERGFIHQISGPDLATIVDGEKRTIYHGIDPSADSAHAGNFVIWMFLKHLANQGHKIIFLVGGGTGMIGDPKPDTERQLKSSEEVEKNVSKLKSQAEKFFSGLDIEFVNNLEWLGNLRLLDFLRDVGKHYTINELVKKDAIATRLQSDNGLSYTEFAYPLLQGYDYLQLYETKGCTVQVGGSDQWGNIVSGVELVRRNGGDQVFAITVPLVIDKATGKKFGKSEGNAVWLDADKTTPYNFYQFWLNVSDESVVDYLNLFTLLSLKDIKKIKQDFDQNPGSRLAQKILAKAVTEMVHGEEIAVRVSNVSGLLFGEGSVIELVEAERKILLESAPSISVQVGTKLVEILVEAKLAISKREARTFIQGGAVTINGEKVAEADRIIAQRDAINGLVLLRRGKKQYSVLKVV